MAEQAPVAGLSVASAGPGFRRGEGFEVLSRQECLHLLGGVGMGRVAVSVGALPTVLPVRFSLVGEDVVFSAGPGSEPQRAVRGAVVALEADHVDGRGGWSVVVTGIATEIGDEARRFFRIPTDMISGRRLPRAPLHVAGAVSASPDRCPSRLDPVPYESIPAEECVRLLATEEVGRLVVVLGGQPLMFPLNYALDGDAVVFRTAPGTKLEAISRSPVAFEVDRWAPSCQSGWSVVVEGIAQEVTSADAPGLRERLARLAVRPLATGDRLHFVRIVPVSITGSRLR